MKRRSRMRERHRRSHLRARRSRRHRRNCVRRRVYPRQAPSLRPTHDHRRQLLRLQHLHARPQPDGFLRRRLLAGDGVLGLQGRPAPDRRPLARRRWRRCSASCRRSSGRSSTSSCGRRTRSRSDATASSRIAPSRSASPSATCTARSAAARSTHRSSSALSARRASSRRAARAARRSSRSGRCARTAPRPFRPAAVTGDEVLQPLRVRRTS